MEMGELREPGGHERFVHPKMLDALECRVTIEPENGVAAASPCTTLRGEVQLPASGDPSGEHLH
jgi:hypothetical protein